ncbi:MAG: xanthine phosphoribosyltransferase [Tissierellia bacterium]|nr:xanthine phosphoribosyltransferase [Tissierellia bacterium]
MKLLEDKILKEGAVLDGNILQVDKFLNHQIDVKLLMAMAEDAKEYFNNVEINKILTVEASGIAIATVFAQVFDVPLVFAKKSQAENLDGEKYISRVKSYTYKNEYDIAVSKKLLNENDKVLIVDDFLAEGNAVYGLISIVEQAGAEVVGIDIAVEKGFQNGGRNLRADGYKLYSQSIIEKFEDGMIVFR